jgi:hypothetical protein
MIYSISDKSLGTPIWKTLNVWPTTYSPVVTNLRKNPQRRAWTASQAVLTPDIAPAIEAEAEEPPVRNQNVAVLYATVDAPPEVPPEAKRDTRELRFIMARLEFTDNSKVEPVDNYFMGSVHVRLSLKRTRPGEFPSKISLTNFDFVICVIALVVVS